MCAGHLPKWYLEWLSAWVLCILDIVHDQYEVEMSAVRLVRLWHDNGADRRTFAGPGACVDCL